MILLLLEECVEYTNSNIEIYRAYKTFLWNLTDNRLILFE